MREQIQTALQIYQDIRRLLVQGQFPGELAPMITQAYEHCTQMTTNLQKALDDGQGTENGNSAGSEAVAGRLGDDEV